VACNFRRNQQPANVWYPGLCFDPAFEDDAETHTRPSLCPARTESEPLPTYLQQNNDSLKEAGPSFPCVRACAVLANCMELEAACGSGGRRRRRGEKCEISHCTQQVRQLVCIFFLSPLPSGGRLTHPPVTIPAVLTHTHTHPHTHPHTTFLLSCFVSDCFWSLNSGWQRNCLETNSE
jgi:hypothetical protein